MKLNSFEFQSFILTHISIVVDLTYDTKYDKELKDSVIHILSKENVLNGVEILPHKSQMIRDIGNIQNSKDTTAIADGDVSVPADNRRQNKSRSRGLGLKTWMGKASESDKLPPVSHLEDPQHLARLSGDRNELAVSIASTIETPEQWVEFCENVGGLEPILQCIHNVAEEIKQGRANEEEIDDMLSLKSVDKFSTACAACKVLRDLCAKDQYWASAITDDILTLNKSGTIISDLVLLLKHANEAERLYSKKAWRQRSRLRKQGVYSTVARKTRKQRRGTLNVNILLIHLILRG